MVCEMSGYSSRYLDFAINGASRASHIVQHVLRLGSGDTDGGEHHKYDSLDSPASPNRLKTCSDCQPASLRCSFLLPLRKIKFGADSGYGDSSHPSLLPGTTQGKTGVSTFRLSFSNMSGN